MAFPTTSILDTFDRANEGPPPSSSWSSSGFSAASGWSVQSNAVGGNSAGGMWGTLFGPDAEAYITWSTLPNNLGTFSVFLRMQQIGAATVDGYQIRWTRNDSLPGFSQTFNRVDNAVVTQLGSTFSDTSGAVSAGIKVGADIVDSTITSYVNSAGTWVTSASKSGDVTYALAGSIGGTFSNSVARGDDFGGGTIVNNQLAWIQA